MLPKPGGRRRWLEKERPAGRYEPELGTPRVRGEKAARLYRCDGKRGSPPRAREKGSRKAPVPVLHGISRAGAGKSGFFR